MEHWRSPSAVRHRVHALPLDSDGLGQMRIARLLIVSLAIGLSVASCSSQPPAVEADQPVTPDEMPDRDLVNGLLAECLVAKGWPVTYTPGPGNGIHFSDNDPTSQAAMRADLDRCLNRLVAEGIVPDPERPLSDEYWRQIYDQDVAIRECLVSNDFPAPTLISFDTYLEERDRDQVIWDPFSELYVLAGTEGEEVLVDAFETCVENS